MTDSRKLRRAYAKGRKDCKKGIKDPPDNMPGQYVYVESYWEGWHAYNLTKVKKIPR